jgi:Tfp pilus assembly protein PilF
MTGKGKPYKSTRGKRTSSKSSSRTDEVINLASEFLDACNPQAAQLIFEEALAANPDDAILLDALGELLYDLGEEEQAKARFLKSAEVKAPTGPTPIITISYSSFFKLILIERS